ncbi:NAD-dependent epimerase/dehydratase family protein [Bacillus suaedaesalsae]|uniref:NAD-dependent epimerase/dehydratase family protein n=1 Tax=Bacillus suaedaesalsae TaxID=2810349 RepID=UPI0032119DFB
MMVVGSMGFVGFHLVKRLLEQGVKVYSIDTFDAKRDNMNEEKMFEIGRNANFISLETLNDEEIEEELQAIFVCYDSEGIEDESYIESFEHLLSETIQWCQTRGTKLIFISTLEAIDHDVEEVTEETDYKPRNRVGELCVTWEKRLNNEYNQKKFSYAILRFPTVYGPWQPSQFAYQQAFEAIESRKPFKNIKESYTEDILYIDDVIEALIRAKSIQASKEIIHITSGRIGEWRKGLDLIDTKLHIEKSMSKAKLSNKKATNILSFKPMVNIQEGIEHQRNHVKNRISTDY